LIYSLAKQPGVGDRDVIVATSPVDSDRATLEMLLPLLTGARLVLPLDKELAQGRALLSLLQRTGATLMYGGSQVWQRLLDAEWIGVPTLKMLASADDVELVRRDPADVVTTRVRRDPRVITELLLRALPQR